MQNICLGHQQLSVDGTAGGVSLTVPAGAGACIIRVATNPIWWTGDATTPSTTNGDPAAVGDVIVFTGALSRFRAIRQSGTGVANISYWQHAEGLPEIATAGGTGTVTGAVTVAGTDASDAPVSANPTLIGGRASTAVPGAVSADGDAVALWTTRLGGLMLGYTDTVTDTNTDNGAAWRDVAGNVRAVAVSSMGFNGTLTEKFRTNVPATLLASAARTATTNTPDQTNYNGVGAMLTINVTVEAAAETLALKLQGKDSISSNYFDICDFGTVYTAATDAPTITRSFLAYPGGTASDYIGITGNGTLAKLVLVPRTWRAVVTHSAVGSWTYSLSAVTML